MASPRDGSDEHRSESGASRDPSRDEGDDVRDPSADCSDPDPSDPHSHDRPSSSSDTRRSTTQSDRTGDASIGVSGGDRSPAGLAEDRNSPSRVSHPDPFSSIDTRPSGVVGRVRWFLTVEKGWPVFVREIVSSVLAVLLVGLLLFAVSGVWPPMVAVESGSMEPHMFRGDLVFIMEEQRLAPDFAHSRTGVVTYEAGRKAEYTRFGGYGDVIVYDAPNSVGPPIIHRARFWVDDGENWYGRADPTYLNGGSCAEIPNCPAPNAGFITRGDANPTYDQVSGIARPVRPDWITGTAEVRVPWLGYIRLEFSELTIRFGRLPSAVIP